MFAFQKVKQKKPEEVSRQEYTGFSEVTANEGAHKQLFRETIKGIRDYLEGIDNRKADARKMLQKL